MKKFLFRFFPLAVAALLAAAAVAQTTPAAKANAAAGANSAKFELSWSQPETPELREALLQLQLTEQSQKQGTVPQEQVMMIKNHIDGLKQRAPYQLTLRSAGGTLREFMAAMSASEEVSFTLINAGEPSDLETEIPAFTLRNANWSTITEVLANFLSTRGLQLKLAGSDRPNPAESKSVVCVLRRVAPADQRPGSPTLFESFSLNYQLANQSIDEIVATIREGWELDPRHDRSALRLKFHPATSILLVSGPPEAIQVAGKVISQLPQSSDKDFKANKAPAPATK